MTYFPVWECPKCGGRFGTEEEAKAHADECAPETWPWEPLEITVKE